MMCIPKMDTRPTQCDKKCRVINYRNVELHKRSLPCYIAVYGAINLLNFLNLESQKIIFSAHLCNPLA